MKIRNVIIVVICSICLTGCRWTHINNRLLKQDYRHQDKYFWLSGKISHYFHEWPDGEKRKLVAESKYYDDDNFQALRFLCWVVEDNPSVRKLLLKQWLTIHNDHGTLAPLEVVLPRISEIISTDSTEMQNERLSELKKAYSKIHHRDKQSKFVHNFVINQYTCITIPIIDHQEPMGLTIFSKDMEKLLKSMQKSDERNHIYFESGDNLFPGDTISVVIRKALTKIDSGMKDSITNKSAGQPTQSMNLFRAPAGATDGRASIVL